MSQHTRLYLMPPQLHLIRTLHQYTIKLPSHYMYSLLTAKIPNVIIVQAVPAMRETLNGVASYFGEIHLAQ